MGTIFKFCKILNRDEAATLWANGIKEKNGTLLFVISNDNVKTSLKIYSKTIQRGLLNKIKI